MAAARPRRGFHLWSELMVTVAIADVPSACRSGDHPAETCAPLTFNTSSRSRKLQEPAALRDDGFSPMSIQGRWITSPTPLGMTPATRPALAAPARCRARAPIRWDKAFQAAPRPAGQPRQASACAIGRPNGRRRESCATAASNNPPSPRGASSTTKRVHRRTPLRAGRVARTSCDARLRSAPAPKRPR